MVDHFDSGDVILKGLDTNDKQGHFRKALFKDIWLAVMSITVVTLGVLLFSKDFILTILTEIGIIFSIGIGFFMYCIVLNIKFFPFLNLLVIIICVIIGVDDFFLLLFQYRNFKNFVSKKKKKQFLI